MIKAVPWRIFFYCGIGMRALDLSRATPFQLTEVNDIEYSFLQAEAPVSEPKRV
jgi:hypothetical protein